MHIKTPQETNHELKTNKQTKKERKKEIKAKRYIFSLVSYTDVENSC